MPLIKRHKVTNGDGIEREIRTVSVGHAMSAVGITLTILLPIIGFFWGQANKELAMSNRIVVLERDHAVMSRGLTDFLGDYNQHKSWSQARSAQMEELRMELRLLKQRQNFYHPQKGGFGADIVPPGLDD